MNPEQQKNSSHNPYENENKEAERLAKELESPLGAQQLGKEAFETAKQEMEKQGKHH